MPPNSHRYLKLFRSNIFTSLCNVLTKSYERFCKVFRNIAKFFWIKKKDPSNFFFFFFFWANLKKVRHLVSSHRIYRQKWKISWILCKPRWCWDHLGSLIYFVRLSCNTNNVSIYFFLTCATNEILFGHKVNSCFYVKILDIKLSTIKINESWLIAWI